MTNLHAAATPQPTAAVQRQLDLAHSQLALYARDLKRIVDAERQKARQLAEANARLQILDRLKTDFLSFIVHELRTPLTSITLAIDFLDPHGDPQEQAKMIERIRKGYERLQRLVQKGLEYFDWLTVEQVNTSDTTDLVEVVRLVTKHMTGSAEPGVDFCLSIADAPCYIRGEEQHLIKVVEILLDNALKFSPKKKKIRVDVRIAAQHVTLTVTDQGRGFPRELAREIFQPFTTTDTLHHSRGTGLNLALATAIVAAYGGQIRAESQGVNQGATFTVAFPALSSEN